MLIIDIINLEREKSIMRCLTKSIPLRIAGLDSASCYSYLISHPNKEILKLVHIVEVAANKITNKWQTNIIKGMTYVGLTICCKDDRYSKILSGILTQVYGYNIEIEKYKGFNVIEKTMLSALLKVSDGMIKDRMHALDSAHELLSDCSNDAISFIHANVLDVVKNDLTEKECNKIIPIFEFLLYTAYLDTAYRDPFFWILNKISRQEIKDVIVRHVIAPHDWYVNVWMRSKELTRQQRLDGKIPPYAHSIVERRMIPAKQTYDLNKKLEK